MRIDEVPGFATGAVHCGIKSAERGQEDLGVIVCEAPCAAAAVFTTNAVCAPPVRLSRRHLKASGGRCRGVVVNAGNANCCTGPQGEADAAAMAAHLADKLGAPAEQILVASTGIIGRHLPLDKVASGIDRAYALAAGEGGSETRDGDFANAILTTDTVRKVAHFRGPSRSGGGKSSRSFLLSGVTKGSGMIAPNMATLLAFLVTDVRAEPAQLQAVLSATVRRTFNRVTIDGDTSTNDTVVLLASGQAEAGLEGPDEDAFREALEEVCGDLARQIARDGEGASHFVTIQVKGAASESDADRVGRTLAESLLVKTAIAGNDPNWGRILAAAGRSGARVDESTFSLTLNGLELFQRGVPLPEPTPERAAEALAPRDVLVEVDLGQGAAESTFYTCDLTHEYVSINADYHT